MNASRTWSVRIQLDDRGGHTAARAVPATPPDAAHYEDARAAGRALRELADRLLAAAAADTGDRADAEPHLVRGRE